MSLSGRCVLVYRRKLLHREFFVLFFTCWNWSVPEGDGLRALCPLGWCAIGISDGILMFPEARKSLPVGLDRWISGGREESLK